MKTGRETQRRYTRTREPRRSAAPMLVEIFPVCGNCERHPATSVTRARL
jgi:hypothetical protein